MISGDLNSNLLCLNNNKLVALMNHFCFTNLTEKPTRVNNQCSTLLDPIIISDSMK